MLPSSFMHDGNEGDPVGSVSDSVGPHAAGVPLDQRTVAELEEAGAYVLTGGERVR